MLKIVSESKISNLNDFFSLMLKYFLGKPGTKLINENRKSTSKKIYLNEFLVCVIYRLGYEMQ